MTGTLLNVALVLLGGLLGLLLGNRLPERLRTTVVAGLGLFTLAYGLSLFLKTQNTLIVLGSLLVGGSLGEWLRLEDRLRSLGNLLEARFAGGKKPGEHPGEPSPAEHAPRDSRFVRGFLTASLIYCIGPMAILGAIQDGLTGQYEMLAIKSILDGVSSIAFAASLGVGVLFSSVMILAYQGGIALLAAQAEAVFSESMMAEISAVGGVLMLGIAISSLLEIKPIRVANFLPALLIAPLIVAILAK